MSFPASPTNGQTTSINGKTYVYNSTKDAWEVAVTSGSVPGTLITPAGTISGNLVVTGNLTVSENAAVTGNATVGGVKTDSYFYANGAAFVPLTTYATTSSLPLSSSAGTMAYVTGNNRLYIYNSGWYAIAAVNQTPTFSSVPDATVTPADINNYTTTLAATDPEGLPIVYGYTIVGGLDSANASINSSTGVFTANFATATSDATITFTATDGTNIASSTTVFLSADQYFKYVSLLLKVPGANAQSNTTFLDSSANNVTVTRNGDTIQGAFTPYAYGDGYWSTYFDGTGDYLAVANNSALDLGTGDFTIECWAYFNALTSNRMILERWTSGNNNGWQLYWRSTGSSITFYAGSSIVVQDPSSSTITTNRWYHIAVSRSGSTVKLFIDGNEVASGTSSTSLTNTLPFTVGRQVSTSTNDFSGYISNVRIVKGTALYTAAFTPSTTSLTAVENTALLTCQSNRFKDNSTNNLTVTKSGDAKVSTFGPLSPSSSYSSSTAGGSAYFDGTGDYLTLPYSTTNYDWWTSDYTLEYWVYPNSLSTWSYNDGARQRPIGVGNMANNTDTNYWSFGPISDGTVRFYYFNGTGVAVTSSQTVNAGQWNHIAITKTSSGITIYVNGVASTTTAVSGTPQSSSGTVFTLGRHNNNAVNGYISNLRIVKGTAVYSGNFTPPTSPVTGITNTSLLLNFTNASIVDASRKNVVYTAGSATASTVQKKFDAENSIKGAESSYVLAPASPELEFGSGDFTIEFWWYPTSTIRQGLYHGSFGIDWTIGIDYSSVSTNQKIGIWASSNGTAWNLINADAGGNGIGTTTVTQNAWNHIAFVRNGTTWMLFVNGNRDLNLTGISGSIVSRSTYPKAIGAWFSEAAMQEQLGYLQDFRISKFARYTANFTAPTSAFITR